MAQQGTPISGKQVAILGVVFLLSNLMAAATVAALPFVP